MPLADGRRALAVMVDPQTTHLAKGEGARAVYLAEVAKMMHLAGIFRDAALDEGPFGWDASMYVAAQMTGDGWLLAGDANSFVDPLSSAGVKKAMASGWLAAVATNTALGDPALTATAMEFFAARERATYDQFLALTRQFLLDGAPAPDHPFWAERALAAPVDDRRDVQAAFDRIRAADSLSFRLGPGVTFAPRPALGERTIGVEERLVTHLVPDGIRYVGAIDLVGLMRAALVSRDVPELLRNLERFGPIDDLPAVLGTLATAVARGWLLAV